jgi:preprotein translocase subunit SecB
MAENTAPAAEQAPPMLNVLGQFIRDFSFENPNAPQSLMPQEEQPSINIQINVNAKPIDETDFDVSLKIEGEARNKNILLFKFELDYGGVFKIQNFPQEHMHPVVLIECPRLLFPFARQIVAEATRQGGFPPLYLDPVDFAQLYQSRMQEMQTSGNA